MALRMSQVFEVLPLHYLLGAKQAERKCGERRKLLP